MVRAVDCVPWCKVKRARRLLWAAAVGVRGGVSGVGPW